MPYLCTMFKAITHIVFSILFLISFIGVNINKHYSHGKLYSTTLFLEAETCCADMEHCEMDNMKSCEHKDDNCSCENKTETIKISDNFVSEKFSFTLVKSFNSLISLNFNNSDIIKGLNFSKYKLYNLQLHKPDKDFCSEFGVFLC